jgi:hypothetical protein
MHFVLLVSIARWASLVTELGFSFVGRREGREREGAWHYQVAERFESRSFLSDGRVFLQPGIVGSISARSWSCW